jgi:putative tricarboxylic transport membrane protein
MGEIIFLVFLLITGGVMFYSTYDFRTSLLDTSGGPALFPRIVLIFLLLMLVIRIVQILCSKEKKQFAFLEIFKGSRLFFILSLGVYIVLIKPLGFILSTVLFMSVLILGFRYSMSKSVGKPGSVAIAIGFSAVYAVLMYVLFAKILNIFLPAGLLGF